MQLKLTVKSYHRLSPGQDSEKILRSGCLTIGRDDTNDWTLPDPTRVMSKLHCIVEGDGETFRLTDRSTNGVFVNESELPVGEINTIILADGDRLRMGDYELVASINGDEPLPRSPKDIEPGEKPIDREDFGLIPDDGGNQSMISAVTDQRLDADSLFLQPSPADSPDPGSLISHDWNSPRTESPPSEIVPSAPEEEFFRPPSPAPLRPPLTDLSDAEPQTPLTGLDRGTQIPEKTYQRAASSERESSHSKNAMLAAFLDGAGLDTIDFPPGSEEQALRKVGEAFRHTVVGIMSILAARHGVRNELRLQQTTIMPTDNNPLKFSIGAEEAMENLLLKEGRGYLGMQEAIIEAFDDINAHQLGLIAGMQEAVSRLLKEIAPHELEKRADKGRGLGDLLTSKKGRYWDTYVGAYDRISNAIDEDFDGLLGRYFSQAYEEQVNRQRRSRR